MSLLLALAAVPLSAAEPSASDDHDASNDCRADGQAGGSSGTKLDSFVEQCLEDLKALELANTADRSFAQGAH